MKQNTCPTINNDGAFLNSRRYPPFPRGGQVGHGDGRSLRSVGADNAKRFVSSVQRVTVQA